MNTHDAMIIEASRIRQTAVRMHEIASNVRLSSDTRYKAIVVYDDLQEKAARIEGLAEQMLAARRSLPPPARCQ